MKRRKVHGRAIFCAILFAFTGSMCGSIDLGKENEEMTISSGNEVSIEYTLRLEDESVVDTNVGSDPLTYVHGSHRIVRGLENGLEGLKIGDTKEVTVQPEGGYDAASPDAFREVDKEQIPPEALEVGAKIKGRDAAGGGLEVRVAEVKDKTVVLDFNHPLAGKTLYFDIKVLDIKKPPV